MEVDTGAALSLVSSETYHNIAQTNEMEPLQEVTVKLRMYTGERINILVACNVNGVQWEEIHTTSFCG